MRLLYIYGKRKGWTFKMFFYYFSLFHITKKSKKTLKILYLVSKREKNLSNNVFINLIIKILNNKNAKLIKYYPN